MAVWNRGRRTDGDNKDGGDDEEFVSLADDEHAWWAARVDLERPWAPKEAAEDEVKPVSDFEKRFSSESLFDWADGTDTFTDGEPDTDRDPTSPFAVLGLPSTATWDEVVTAHRQLAKLHHPDRLQDAEPDVRMMSEQTMRHVNAAYQELRERFKA